MSFNACLLRYSDTIWIDFQIQLGNLLWIIWNMLGYKRSPFSRQRSTYMTLLLIFYIYVIRPLFFPGNDRVNVQQMQADQVWFWPKLLSKVLLFWCDGRLISSKKMLWLAKSSSTEAICICTGSLFAAQLNPRFWLLDFLLKVKPAWFL